MQIQNKTNSFWAALSTDLDEEQKNGLLEIQQEINTGIFRWLQHNENRNAEDWHIMYFATAPFGW